jgi:hypothetical protein
MSGKRDIEAKKLLSETMEVRREKNRKEVWACWPRRHTATDAI